jgi:hypothetical protein
MKEQFLYNRSVPVEGSTETKIVQDSFNITKVIRTMTIEDDKVLVLLDDLHERVQEVPEVNPKTGKIGGMRRERNTFQSEIYLDKEDGARFFKLTGI